MYRKLDPEKIIETSATLKRRISERFEGSGLSEVAAHVEEIAGKAVARTVRFRRPNLALRAAVALLIALMVGLLVVVLSALRFSDDVFDVANFVQVFDAAIGSAVFVSIAILFLMTIETRLKRRRTLEAVHELRSLAHIVDMHQLTKNPDRVLRRGPSTKSSPTAKMTPFELNRYLNYCSELLSLLSKISVLYVQDFSDSVALDAVDQIEDLTTGLSRKIWQKIMLLDRVAEQVKVEPQEAAR